MKTILAALASAALLAMPMASISTPAAAQSHGGGFHGVGAFRGGGSRGPSGGFHGAGGFHGGDSPRGGLRNGHRRGRDDGTGLIFGPSFGDPYDYDDPYDGGPYDYGSSACGSWFWDGARGRYQWIPC